MIRLFFENIIFSLFDLCLRCPFICPEILSIRMRVCIVHRLMNFDTKKNKEIIYLVYNKSHEQKKRKFGQCRQNQTYHERKSQWVFQN